MKRGSPHAKTLAVDLASVGGAESVIQWVEAEISRIDALVNNAGAGIRQAIEETTHTLLNETFAVNTFAPAMLIAGAWPLMQKQALREPDALSPAIVNVSSMAAIDPFPGLFAYAASKAALESFVRSIVNEPAERRVRAFAIAPGSVQTPLLRSVFKDVDIPRERTLSPDAVAAVIVDCILGRRDGDIGTTIVVPSP